MKSPVVLGGRRDAVSCGLLGREQQQVDRVRARREHQDRDQSGPSPGNMAGRQERTQDLEPPLELRATITLDPAHS
jgi:hypothetical protein